ncbi:hypothetical protein VMCG_02726 [Cytospora schulzeri]|uniref:Uncharacterized protein n=1 Tax=Cytospora schulzeri TaxID=448051 RepID=A0A423WZ35_9PEZI|nr:hypothetical protein VMCG_02726 [Valsa malicola]
MGTASLSHLLKGSFPKAMSDAGVDFYALTAAYHLGKCVPVRKSLESTVHAHLASRGSIRSVHNDTLSIGWDHSEVAIEMSRTPAGTSALQILPQISGNPMATTT